MMVLLESNAAVSKIFDAIGLGGMDIAIPLILFFLVTVALIVIVILQSKRQAALVYRLERFMQGEEAVSLEDQIGRLASQSMRARYRRSVS